MLLPLVGLRLGAFLKVLFVSLMPGSASNRGGIAWPASRDRRSGRRPEAGHPPCSASPARAHRGGDDGFVWPAAAASARIGTAMVGGRRWIRVTRRGVGLPGASRGRSRCGGIARDPDRLRRLPVQAQDRPVPARAAPRPAPAAAGAGRSRLRGARRRRSRRCPRPSARRSRTRWSGPATTTAVVVGRLRAADLRGAQRLPRPDRRGRSPRSARPGGAAGRRRGGAEGGALPRRGRSRRAARCWACPSGCCAKRTRPARRHPLAERRTGA